MYILYYSPSAASFAVHWLLNELVVPHELVLIDLDAKQQKSAEYLRLNPSGMVPTLMVDGVPRTECAALLMLLAERHPESKLAPSVSSAGRAEYLQWMFYFANTLQPAYRAWFYPQEPAGDAHVDAVKAQARKKIEEVWTRLDEHLSSRMHIAANSLSAVDLFATMLLRWSRNMPKPALEWPNIKVYVQRMRALPSFLKTMRAEGLTDWLNVGGEVIRESGFEIR